MSRQAGTHDGEKARGDDGGGFEPRHWMRKGTTKYGVWWARRRVRQVWWVRSTPLSMCETVQRRTTSKGAATFDLCKPSECRLSPEAPSHRYPEKRDAPRRHADNHQETTVARRAAASCRRAVRWLVHGAQLCRRSGAGRRGAAGVPIPARRDPRGARRRGA